jgi:hypothetical protein
VAASAEEQRCECVFGYHRDASGVCEWDGLLDDPEFALGCAAWRLTVVRANPDHVVAAKIAEGELRLAVSHRCSNAAATADARLPAPQTVPHAALRFSANGSVGALLSVSFNDRSGGPAPFFGTAAATGTGERQEVVVCLDLMREIKPAVVQFSVGQYALCNERIDHEFSIRAVSVISYLSCQ